MIVHCVTFTWRPDVPPKAVDALEASLTALRVDLGLSDYSFGRDLGLAAGNADYGVVALFATEAQWRDYIDHPEHQRIIADQVKPILRVKSTFQIRGG